MRRFIALAVTLLTMSESASGYGYQTDCQIENLYAVARVRVLGIDSFSVSGVARLAVYYRFAAGPVYHDVAVGHWVTSGAENRLLDYYVGQGATACSLDISSAIWPRR